MLSGGKFEKEDKSERGEGKLAPVLQVRLIFPL